MKKNLKNPVYGNQIYSKTEEIIAEIEDKKEGKIKSDIKNLIIKVQNGATTLDEIIEIQNEVQSLKDEIIVKESYKWYVAIYGFIFTFILFCFVIYPIFYSFIATVAKSVVLSSAIINENMIP